MKKLSILLLLLVVLFAGAAQAVQQINRAGVAHPTDLEKLLNAFATEKDQVRALINEIRTDHATIVALGTELKAWAQQLATDLNNDAGVSGTTFDAVISNSPPSSLSNSAVTNQVNKSK
jgi:ABC-type branched-subunit amino acid transport system substrate-binding protein